jgi:hypothetical protein
MNMIGIKGMKMPKSCSDCDFCHGHLCKRTGVDIVANPKDECPLVEIITCEDCKFNDNTTCTMDGFGVVDDYFCASAERKE